MPGTVLDRKKLKMMKFNNVLILNLPFLQFDVIVLHLLVPGKP